MNPVLAEVCRRGIVESVHRGSALVVNYRGDAVLALGDVERNIYPRSSLKFFQSIPLVESGAADHYELTQPDLSLACASHNAETFHVEAVQRWLGKLKLTAEDLECGPALPMHEPTAQTLLKSGDSGSRLHMNCSGKHTGMLTMARYLGEPTQGYSLYEHAVQQIWLQSVSTLLQENALDYPWERDGCGMPAVCMPMRSLAIGFARFSLVEPDGIPSSMQNAIQRLTLALRTHPEMMAGTQRCCTAVIRETSGEVLVKTGAEAVFGGVIPKCGLGFAIKIDDGNPRGSEVALGALLGRLGVMDEQVALRLKSFFNPVVKNSQGWETGEIRASKIWQSV
ncbi:MAG: asparaginase [Pseudomonadota bacterium]